MEPVFLFTGAVVLAILAEIAVKKISSSRGFPQAPHGSPIVTPFDALFVKAGGRFAIDPRVMKALFLVENGANIKNAERARLAANRNRNGTVDLGVMQVNSANIPFLKSMGIVSRPEDLYDAERNILGAAAILKSLRAELGNLFTLDRWLASYNAGAPAVRKNIPTIPNPEYLAKARDAYNRVAEGESVA